jgi:polyisoprenoid-binding protein YceI
MCLLAGAEAGMNIALVTERNCGPARGDRKWKRPPARTTKEHDMALSRWNFDTVHSHVSFWVRHLMVSKVHGQFTKWSGQLAFDEENPSASHAEATIDASSIDTREPQRDGHLRSGDFFDVEMYPTIEFRSTMVERAGAHFKVTGDLTIHGVKKPVTLDVEYAGRAKHPQMGERIGFSAKTSINRKDFGLIWNQVLEAGGIAVGENIEIQIEIEASKAD